MSDGESRKRWWDISKQPQLGHTSRPIADVISKRTEFCGHGRLHIPRGKSDRISEHLTEPGISLLPTTICLLLGRTHCDQNVRAIVLVCGEKASRNHYDWYGWCWKIDLCPANEFISPLSKRIQASICSQSRPRGDPCTIRGEH